MSNRIISWSTTVLWAILVCLGVALALNALLYLNFDANYKFLKLKQEAIATGWYLPFYYSHVLISAVILLCGFFQVSGIGRKWIKLHRALGYVYVMGILFFAAPGGFVMSLFIGRGPFVLASFITQGLLWFICTSIAFQKIRQGDIIAHRHWMWRSFALTFAAITLRIYIFISSYSFDLSQPAAYATLAWLSWVPNIVFVEFYIRSHTAKSR
jgi:uncharacterized membrane protein